MGKFGVVHNSETAILSRSFTISDVRECSDVEAFSETVFTVVPDLKPTGKTTVKVRNLKRGKYDLSKFLEELNELEMKPVFVRLFTPLNTTSYAYVDFATEMEAFEFIDSIRKNTTQRGDSIA